VFNSNNVVLQERRQAAIHDPAAQPLAGLTPEQRSTLETLEHFGWRVDSVRRKLFMAPVPVLVDRSGSRYVAIEADGSLDENPTVRFSA
jgi:hypothetical protein